MPYYFGEYCVDAEGRELRRAETVLAVEPRVFEVLLYLLTHRDRVVSRDELLQHCWPDTFVSDAALTRCVGKLRQALGHMRQGPQIIQTFHRQGYRFMAEVMEDEQVSGPPAPPAAAPEPPPPVWHVPDESRMHVTVLCGSIAPVAPPPAPLPPERHLYITAWFFEAAQRHVDTYGGELYAVLDDHCVAIFGAREAREDHAWLALLAAADLRREWHAALDAQRVPLEEPWTICFGVHTGHMVGRRLGVAEQRCYFPLGNTFQKALCLMQQSRHEAILLSESTRSLVHDHVRARPYASESQGGSTEPPAAYLLESFIAQHLTLPRRQARMRTPLVGRARELDTLTDVMTRVAAGHGQVVGIVGEPGIGKSRLLYEFRRRLTGQRVVYHAAHCVSYASAVPYFPLREIVRQHCDITETHEQPVVRAKIRHGLQTVGIASEVWENLLLFLLGIFPEHAPETNLSPQAIRAQTFEALVQLCRQLSRQGPLVLDIEDLHWIDATSEAWLTFLIDRLAGWPIMVLLTYRPGYRRPWAEKSYVTQLTLAPLGPHESRQIMRAAYGSDPMPAALVEHLQSKAQGNPLFLEELSQACKEQSTGQDDLTIPETLETVLAARINRLPADVRGVLQMAAVIADAIPLQLLTSLMTMMSHERLHDCLARLQEAEFLYETALMPHPVYTFKHILIQEVAYNALLTHARQRAHHEIAQALEHQFPDLMARQPERLAHHYTEAGCFMQAASYWARAGEGALAQSSYVEAASHFTNGLEAVARGEDSEARLQHEIVLTLRLGTALSALKGYAAPEVEQTFERAHALCEQRGDPRQLFATRFGLFGVYLLWPKVAQAQELATQLLALAEAQNETGCIACASLCLGVVAYYSGHFLQARVHLERGIALYEPDRHAEVKHLIGQDLAPMLLSYLGLTVWALGYPDQALVHAREALRLATVAGHPFGLAMAHAGVAEVQLFRREPQAAHEQAAIALDLATEQMFPQWQASANTIIGWSQIATGHLEAGVAKVRAGISQFEAAGTKQGLPHYLNTMAEASRLQADFAAGLQCIETALTLATHTGVHAFEAESYRLQGELWLAQGQWRQAGRSLEHALTLADRQQAKSWELRAATSLARLWQQQNQPQEAHNLLAPVYNWFTEGFETPDLQEAKALLDALGG